ncbi:MAG TPA: class A beta-lactamase [Bosea sp. (in: a-proteobacteria)]|jgi:beta-lactamase class A|nr:class A beta-lactamase [Bosea sp. (in: a-proteobacteria)]
MTMLSRRQAVGAIAGMSVPLVLSQRPAVAQATADPVTKVILEVEARLQSRLGVRISDLESGRAWSYRADERFPMCSTFKGLAAAAVLARVDQGRERLDRRMVFDAREVVTYSPVTKERVGEPGMTIADICAAAVATSDNTAGNLMLRMIAGPEGLTGFLRGVGDEVTRLDRWETDLNEGKPGDPRDTTSPAAMNATMEKLALGSVLSAASRKQLVDWLIGNKVGDTKVRAGVPKDWTVGDKTGGGGFGTNNDTGIIWPPGRKPIVFTILTTETKASLEDKNAGMAEIAKALHRTVAS